MTTPNIILLLGVIGTLLGAAAGLTSLLYVRPTRRKLVLEAQKAGAEASEVIVKGAVALLEPLQRRVEALESLVEKQRVRIEQGDVALAQLQNILELERKTAQDTIRELKRQIEVRDQRIAQLVRRGPNGAEGGK